MTPAHGYNTAHERIWRERGRAALQLCVHCMGAAQEWAYNHDSPDQNALVDTSGRTYSNDPGCYVPLCVKCHRRYDARHVRTECPQGHSFAGDNVVLENGHRRCRECRNAYQRELRKQPVHQAKERDRAHRRRLAYVKKPPRPEVTHCPQGHAYVGDNLIVDAGKRKCRECGRVRSRRYYHRTKAARQHRALS